MSSRTVFPRLLALWLTLGLALPGPASALRQTGLEESDDTKRELTAALLSSDRPDPTAQAQALLTQALRGYLEKSLQLWTPDGEISIPSGLGEAGRETLEETYQRYWAEIRRNLQGARSTLSTDGWRSETRQPFIQILEKHLGISNKAASSFGRVRPSWGPQTISAMQEPELLKLGPLALFTVFFDQAGFVREAYSIPAYFHELHIHDQGSNFWLGRGMLPFQYALRGTFHGELSSAEGFVRLDPPSDPEVFLKEKWGGDSVPSEVRARYPEILAEEVVNLLTYLSEGGVHSGKLVVLLREVREVIGRRYGVNVPEGWTLGQLLSAVQRPGSEFRPATRPVSTPPAPGQVVRSVRVADPQGIHLRTAKGMVDQLQSVSPDTKVTVLKGNRSANARGITDLLQLAVGPGETVQILAEGPKAEEAVEALARFLEGAPERAGLEELIDLTGVSGLPIFLDPKSWTLKFGEGIHAVSPMVRRIGELREVALDPQRLTPASSQAAYWMYRNLYDPADAPLLAQNKLRYDVTVLAPSDAEHRLAEELLKTYGHYHPPRDPLPYPEVYEVLYGEAWFLLQRPAPHNPGVIEDVVLVKAEAGDKVIMLPGYGHITINPSATQPLVMANWVSSAFNSQYERYHQYRGAAYYVTGSGPGGVEFLPNRAYERVPPIREMHPAAHLPPFGLKAGEPMYPLLKRDPQKLLFLNEPERFREVFAQALVPVAGAERLRGLAELLNSAGVPFFRWQPAIQEDPALLRQAVDRIPRWMRQDPRQVQSLAGGEGVVQLGWGLEMRPAGSGAVELAVADARPERPYGVYLGFAGFLRQRAREAGATALWLNEGGAFYQSPSVTLGTQLDGVFLPEGLWEFLRDRHLTLSLAVALDHQAAWGELAWLLDPRTLRRNIPVEADSAGASVSIPLRGPGDRVFDFLRGKVSQAAMDSQTGRILPTHFLIQSAAGLEEVEVWNTTPTDESFWEAFRERLTEPQLREVMRHRERAEQSGRRVEITAVTGLTDFYLHTDGGLAAIAQRVAEKYPVEGMRFHTPGDLSQRAKTPQAFETPGLIVPDRMMPAFVWPEGSRPPVRVLEPLDVSDMAEIRPAGWVALSYNPNLTIEHVLSQDVLLITVNDDQGTAVLVFA